jgi:long-chain acyl-CoA synthetase
MVIGAGERFTGALIVPSFPALKEWAKAQGIEALSNERLVGNDKVIDHYKNVVDEMNKCFNLVEQVKKFELLPLPWNLDNGEITPGLGKLRRKVIMERHAGLVRKIYD